MTDNPTVYLIDASGYIFRAYFAIRERLTAADGTPTNAVYGFASMIAKFVRDEKPARVALVFDRARKSFRNEIYADYKAHRPDPPADLIPQFDLVREVVRAYGLPLFELDDYEADDIIATLAERAHAEGRPVVIVSADKDLAQLVRDGVVLYDPMRERRLDAAGVQAHYGVPPSRIVDWLALAGDASDNIPGVPRIGDKTAVELLARFDGLDALLADPDAVAQSGLRGAKGLAETLRANVEPARISYRLATLKRDVPVNIDPDTLVYKGPDRTALKALFLRLGFRRTAGLDTGGEAAPQGDATPTAAPATADVPAGDAGPSKSAGAAGVATPAGPVYRRIRTLDELDAVIAACRAAGRFAFDTETASLHTIEATAVGFSLAAAPGEGVYVPLAHRDAVGALVPGQPPRAEALARLKPLLEDPTLVKVLHNAKFDMNVVFNDGIALAEPIDDTLLVSWVIDAGRAGGHGMDALAKELLGYTTVSYASVTGTGKKQITFDRVDLDAAARYAAEDAEVTLRLDGALTPALDASPTASVYRDIDRPLVPVLAHMERAGIALDTSVLAELSVTLDAQMKTLDEQIYAAAGETFNPASPPQLARVLFDKLKLPIGRRTDKAAAQSTDADELERLSEFHPLPALVLERRQIAKLKGTYIDALPKLVHPRTGRVHTHFNPIGALTGRLSSTDPNLQNIPVRTETGRRIRSAFVATPGYVLLSADYSQIELRVLAHMSGDPALGYAFARDLDIHRRTAAEVFGVADGDVTPELRRRAKAVNFGIIYGQTAHGLALGLGISRTEAKVLIDAYFAQYPGIRAAMDGFVERARADGFVTTLFGRRVPTPEIRSSTPARRAFAERAAVNAPIQGTAADIVKIAMRRVYDAMHAEGFAARGTRLLLQVHDELVFEVPEADADAFVPVVLREMSGAAVLDVPLRVDAGRGRHWGEAH